MQPQRCWLHGATATEGLALVLDKISTVPKGVLVPVLVLVGRKQRIAVVAAHRSFRAP